MSEGYIGNDDLDEICSAVDYEDLKDVRSGIKSIIRLLGANYGFLNLRYQLLNKYELEVFGKTNSNNKDIVSITQPPVSDFLFSSDRSLIIDDPRMWIRTLNNIVKLENVGNRLLYIPLLFKHVNNAKKVGELLFLYNDRFIEKPEKELLKLIIKNVLTKIELYYASGRMNRKDSQLRRLIEIGKNIETIENKDDLLRTVVGHVEKEYKLIFGHEPVFILRIRKGDAFVRIDETKGYDFILRELMVEEPVFSDILKSRKPEIINDPQKNNGIMKLRNENADNRSYRDFFDKMKSLMLIPIVTKDEVKGMYCLFSTDRSFDLHEMRYFQGMAIITSIALNKLEDYEIVDNKLKEKVKRLELLNELMKDIRAEKNDEKLMKKILESGLKLVNANLGNIRIMDKENNELKKMCGTSEGQPGSLPVIPVGQGICGKVFEQKRAIKIDNIFEEEECFQIIKDKIGKEKFHEMIEKKQFLVSEISAPLMDGFEVIGTIDAHKNERNGFTNEDKDILENLGALAGVLLNRMSLNNRFNLLKSIALTYNPFTEEYPSEIMKISLHKSLEIMECGMGAIAILDSKEKSEGKLRFLAIENIKELKEGDVRVVGEGIMGIAANEKKVINIDDVTNFPGHIVTDRLIKSELALPMLFNGNLKGVFMIASSRRKKFHNEDEQLLKFFANYLALIIHNCELIKEQERNNKNMENQLVQNLINFAGMMAHQINTPLTGIQLSASNISDKLKLKRYDFDENINSIFESVSRAAGIINKIKEFAKMEKLEIQSKDIHYLLDTTVAFVKSISNAKRIKIIINYDKANIKAVKFDYFKIQQVFLNLIDNALKAMEEKGDTLKITTILKGNHINIIFEDNGIGISKENMDKIFLSFFTTNHAKGTGLGLSICKRFIEEHKGNIFVESEERKWTRFRIEFPVNQED